MVRCVGLAMIGLMAGAGVEAQVRMRAPGDSSVTGRDFQPYAVEWRMVYRGADGGERAAGRWVDTVDVVTIDDEEFLRRVQRSWDADGKPVNRQVHLVHRATMAPLRSHLSAGTWIKHVEYRPGGVLGFILADPEAPMVSLDTALTAEAFDFGVAGTFLLALHLAPGDTVQFPSYALQHTGVDEHGRPTGLRVGVESFTVSAGPTTVVVAGALGRREALPATVVQGGRTLTFWLIDGPPYIARLTSKTSAGATIWELR